MHTRSNWARLVVLMALCLPLIAGCSEDNDNGGGTPTTQVPPQMVQEQAVATLGFLDGVILSADAIATGDFGSLPEFATRMSGSDDGVQYAAEFTDPVFNDGMWTVTYSFSDESGNYAVTYEVQYLDGAGSPQLQPDGTTAEVSFAVGMDFDFTFTDENGTTDVELTYANAMAIDGLPAGPYGLVGQGSMTGTASGVTTTGSIYSYTNELGWALDVTAPAGGCPTGTATISSGPYTINATYGGASTVDWVMLENGTEFASGTEISDCGAIVTK